MHMFGDANWLLPRWLDRRLPHLAIEPAANTPAPSAPVSLVSDPDPKA
jgi:RND superfamily putative drug exporter